MLPPYPFAFFTFFFHLLLFSSHCFSVSRLWRNAAQSPTTPKWIHFAFAESASAQLRRTTWFQFLFPSKMFTFLTAVKWLHSCQAENKLFYLKKVNTISVWPMTLETVWRYSILAHKGTQHAYRNTLQRCLQDLSSAYRAFRTSTFLEASGTSELLRTLSSDPKKHS